MQSPDDLPEPALTHDRHGSMLLIGPCYTAEQMRAYRAEGVAQERERWLAPVREALQWMEEAWHRIDGEWGPCGDTLDQRCADGREPDIAALRALLKDATTS